MAAVFDEGFSIRDYTSKMRSIDAFKCWPFSSTISRDVTRDEVQSWLPPMTTLRCPRSNHHNAENAENHCSTEEPSRTDNDDGYASEDSVKSDRSVSASATADAVVVPPPVAGDDEKLEMVCPVCREFNAATLTAVNAHIDGCLAQTMREERRHMRMMNLKSIRSKPPKKRSIAEIFKVDDEKEEEEEKKEEKEEEEPRIDKVLKFWPFPEGADEVSITVTKFRWLSRRLDALRSNRRGRESAKSDEEDEKSEMVCPVCRDFNAATVTAVNAHIDGCLAQAVREERRQMRRTSSSKPKLKAPKKRSIAEILNAAPPIEATKSKAVEVTVNEVRNKSDYDGADSDSAIIKSVNNKIPTNKHTKKKGKKKKKKSKLESSVSLNNEKKSKKKKKKKLSFNNELNGNKEDGFKLQNAVNSSRKLKCTIGNKKVALPDSDPSVHRKKLFLNGLPVEKKQKFKDFGSVGMQQKTVSPVRVILKNDLKHVSGKTSSGCSVQNGNEESCYNDQVPTSDAHERFSGKDAIRGLKKRDSFNETMFNSSTEVLATSLVKEQSYGSDEEASSFEENKTYDRIAVSADRDKRDGVCHIVESKQFSNTLEQVTVPNFLKPCTSQEKSQYLEEKSELLTEVATVCDNNNLRLFNGGNTTKLHRSPYADISRPLSGVQEEQVSCIDTQVCESLAFSSSRNFVDHLEDPSFQVQAARSNENTKTFLEPSSSYSASYNKANEKPESPSQTYGDNDNSGQALGDRQLSDVFSADTIDNPMSFTDWVKASARGSCMDSSFFGLPLNSHGELISFSSGGKVAVKQPESSSTLQGSPSGLPVNNTLRQNNQESGTINERHVVQKTFPKDGLNPFAPYPARYAVSEFQHSEREDIHRPDSAMCSDRNVKPLNSELNLEKNSSIEQNQHNQVWSHNGNGAVSLKESSGHISPSCSQPTVRLMGKDVAIGKSSEEMQQFADVWTDEESRRRHHFQYAAIENSLLGRCSKQDWVSSSPLQILWDNGIQSAKTQSNHQLRSTILMNGTDSGFPQRFTDLQGNLVSQNGSLRVSRNTGSYFNPVAQESTSYAVFNGAAVHFPEQFMPGAKPQGFSSQSQVLPAACKLSRPSCSSNAELNDSNRTPHVTKAAFGFPFLQPAVKEQAKTSSFQRPYRGLPSWLSGSTGETLPGTFSQQFSGAYGQSFPQNRWGNNFSTPAVNHKVDVLFPSNPLTSLGPMMTAPCSVSIVQPLPSPVTSSTIDNGWRNRSKVPDGVNLDDTITKEYYPCTNARKRTASNLDCRKPIKLPNIGIQENWSHMTRLTGENSGAELLRNTRVVELGPQVDGARSRSCQNEAQNLNPTGYPAVDSFKLAAAVTSGPVQLSCKRAKHILKSS